MNSPTPDAQPAVSVVVVNFNGGQDLADCLAALCGGDASPSFEVLVVDNASSDGSRAAAEAFAARDARVRLLPSPANRGYAGGVNLALAHARGKYVAALNPDMIAGRGWLRPLVDFCEAHPDAGALNPLILLDSTGDLINAAGQTVHVTGLGFNRWLGQPRARAGATPLRVSGIQGGAAFIRRDVLDQAGGWDESGFLYHEDVELSWLIQLMGYDLYCVPDAVVRHRYHLSMYPEKLFLLERNRWAMLCANLRAASVLVLSPLLLLTEAMMWAYCALRGWPFVRAKAASFGWLVRQGPAIRARRRFVETVRRRSDRQLLRRLAWGYAWDQFVTLGRERGASSRQPAGGPPVRLREDSLREKEST